eukprot:TRINITY_DN3345_c1_g1_i4.p1 TRINITY_DN3345_c1_g1~~TRINITY_DN3345_c1_g1_i4.p1  ORF type:complete len:851 (-),score=115.98 TRINITY_DN3345_c1_g1_i4:383-2935(-)
MAEAVVVGVRVRPFNDREKMLKAELCVAMQGQTTYMKRDGGGTENADYEFNFDQSFWSHDEFENDSNGYSHPIPGGKYADQKYVYDKFGERVLDNAWQGFHVCLFAYGQTGAGKSYSMVGYGANKGIIPIACEQIFERVNKGTDSGHTFGVVVSVIEIYNENVQDLLVAPDDRPRKGLEIRESKLLGIYVEGVIKRPVVSYEQIEKTLEEATEHRTVGATLMNATSSRAHTVLTIEFKQAEKIGNKESAKVSMINLVDLAGSEKAGQTGATGDRLKEGSAINKSLSALGNVIEKLAAKCSAGKNAKAVVIPYRDSKLTRLLQNALGGSSKTIMICALSPASSNFEETLSTLRYADRAKKIKNTAVVNENPQDKLLRELKEENDKLKQMMSGSGAIDSSELDAKREEIARAEAALKEMQKSFEERLKESNEARMEAERNLAAKKKEKAEPKSLFPFIANLNEDQQLVAKIRYEFPDGETTLIGQRGGEKVRFKHGIPVPRLSENIRRTSQPSIDAGMLQQECGLPDSSSDNDDDYDSDSPTDSSDEEEPDVHLVGEEVASVHCAVTNCPEAGCVLHVPKHHGNYQHEWGWRGEHTFVNGMSIGQILSNRSKVDGANPRPDILQKYGEGAVVLEHGDRVTIGLNIFFFVDPRGMGRGLNPAEVLIVSQKVTFAGAVRELAQARWRNTASYSCIGTTRTKLKMLLLKKKGSRPRIDEGALSGGEEGFCGKSTYKEEISRLLRSLEEKDKQIANLKAALQTERMARASVKVGASASISRGGCKKELKVDKASPGFEVAESSLRQALELLNSSRAAIASFTGEPVTVKPAKTVAVVTTTDTAAACVSDPEDDLEI